MRIFGAFALASAILATSCISLTSLQTARTTKKDKLNAYGAIGSQGIRFTKKSSDKVEADVQKVIEDIRVPILEGGIRYGLGESWDVGAKYALIPGTIGVDTKYSLLDLSTPYGLAVGIAADYTSFSKESGDQKNKSSVTNIIFPVYTSYDFAESSAVYFTPKYILQSISSTSTNSSESKSNSATISTLGLSTGVKLSNFFLEYSLMSSVGTDTSMIYDQFALGVTMFTDAENHHSQYADRRYNNNSSRDSSY